MGLEDLKNKNDNKLDYDERLFLLTKKEEIACCIEELISDIYQENLSRTDSICIGLGIGTNDQLLTRYQGIIPETGTDQAKEMLTYLDTANLQNQEKNYLKGLLICTYILYKKGYLTQLPTTGVALKSFFLQPTFWQALHDFQTKEKTLSDCIIGGRTIENFKSYMNNITKNKQSQPTIADSIEHTSTLDTKISEGNKYIQTDKKKLLQYGITIPDEYVDSLNQVYQQESGSGRKRKNAEKVASSIKGRIGLATLKLLGIDNILGYNIHIPKSLGPFQIQIEVLKQLMKEANIQTTLQKILDHEGFNNRTRKLSLGGTVKGKDLKGASYNTIKDILNNPIASLYLAYEIFRKNMSFVYKKFDEAGVNINRSDQLVTAQFMYNKGPEATYGAILQQELYKIAQKNRCNPPNTFVFDGTDGNLTQSLVNCLIPKVFTSLNLTTNNHHTISHINGISVTNTAQITDFFKKAQLPYYPALDTAYLKALVAGSDGSVRPHYVSKIVKESKKLEEVDTSEKFTGSTIEENELTKIINKFNDRSDINYRSKGSKTKYNAKRDKGNFDCTQFVRFMFSDQDENRQNNSKLKHFSFREMFGDELTLSGYMTKETYRDSNAYKNQLKNIQIGDIIGFGEKIPKDKGKYINGLDAWMSMSHGAIVSKLVKNAQGEIVNVYMTHSTSGGKGAGPSETLLFGSEGYYEKICLVQKKKNNKNIVCFGRLKSDTTTIA